MGEFVIVLKNVLDYNKDMLYYRNKQRETHNNKPYFIQTACHYILSRKQQRETHKNIFYLAAIGEEWFHYMTSLSNLADFNCHPNHLSLAYQQQCCWFWIHVQHDHHC